MPILSNDMITAVSKITAANVSASPSRKHMSKAYPHLGPEMCAVKLLDILFIIVIYGCI